MQDILSTLFISVIKDSVAKQDTFFFELETLTWNEFVNLINVTVVNMADFTSYISLLFSFMCKYVCLTLLIKD